MKNMRDGVEEFSLDLPEKPAAQRRCVEILKAPRWRKGTQRVRDVGRLFVSMRGAKPRRTSFRNNGEVKDPMLQPSGAGAVFQFVPHFSVLDDRAVARRAVSRFDR